MSEKKTLRPEKIKIKRATNNEWRVHLVGVNGETLMISTDTYKDIRNAKRIPDLLNQNREIPFPIEVE
jgi:uncharacterized protein YegP (UPF0339 family)